VVPRETPGLSVGRDEELLGLRGSPTTELMFEDVAVPAGNLLGAEGGGFGLAMQTLDDSRLNAATIALGIARAAVQIAVDYARSREQFGKPIIQHQGLAFVLAEVVTELNAGWALLGGAIEALERERSRAASAQAAMAKLFCTDAAMHATTEAVQVLGGYGLTRDFVVERLMRDVKAFQIFDGTNQIQKLIIGRHLEKVGLPMPDTW
jgi:alkylation response protein AidB-like acyl-CoA dehydrogenase